MVAGVGFERPFRKHSRLTAARYTRLVILLVSVIPCPKQFTGLFWASSPTPSGNPKGSVKFKSHRNKQRKRHPKGVFPLLVAGVGFESPFLKYGRNLRLGTLGSISPYFSYSLRKNDSPDRFYSLAHSLRKPEGKRKAQITPQAKRKVILKDDFLSGCGGGI